MTCDIFLGNQVANELEAYLLGFFYADGCVYKDIFSLALSERDVDFLKWILDVLNNRLKSNYKLYHHTKTKSYKFHICNRDFVKNIIRLGVIPKKTYENNDFVFQNVPDNLKRHFLRGYFDGDGSICRTTSQNKWAGNIVSLNETLIQSVYKYCVEHLECGTIHKDGRYTRLYLSGNVSMRKFAELIYRDAHYFLDRKRQKFDMVPIYHKNNVYTGITKYYDKYRVNIYSKPTRKQLYLGLCDTLENAIALYNEYSESCQQQKQCYKGDNLYYE